MSGCRWLGIPVVGPCGQGDEPGAGSKYENVIGLGNTAVRMTSLHAVSGLVLLRLPLVMRA
jgi:hypothetical protein